MSKKQVSTWVPWDDWERGTLGGAVHLQTLRKGKVYVLPAAQLQVS